jgi:hypothetical protein
MSMSKPHAEGASMISALSFSGAVLRGAIMSPARKGRRPFFGFS